MTAFSELLATLVPCGDGHAVSVPEDWLQGRTAFGGLVAALAIEAATRSIPALPALRAAQFAFIGPASGPLVLTPSVLRKGRSVSFVSVEVTSEAGLAMRALLCFGEGRESALVHRGHPAPLQEAAAPDGCGALLGDGISRPAFVQHFDLRLAGREAPLSRGAPDLLVWSKHRDSVAGAPQTALIALGDALPPSAVCMAAAMPRMSTMTWSVELAPGAGARTLDWCLVRRTADIIAEGYVAESVSVWSEDGTPLLTGRQSVAIFD